MSNNSSIPARTTCRVCWSTRLTDLFSLGEQYVSNFVPKEQIHTGPQCPIDLQLCQDCTLVQMKHTAPQDFLYSRHYWYRSGVTGTMEAALRDVVKSAVARVDLQDGDIVLDIGANDGTLLGRYPYYTDKKIVKFACEPAVNLREECASRCDVLIDDFWSADAYFLAGVSDAIRKFPYLKQLQDPSGVLSPRTAKVITAIGMFYDLEDPNQFIADVAKVLHPDGVFVAQLQCLKQTVELADVGNFCHEHLEYYSLRSLISLLSIHGLVVYDVEENKVNGGSYRVYARHSCDPRSIPAKFKITERLRKFVQTEEEMGLENPETYARLYRRMDFNRHRCNGLIMDLIHSGKKVWVYGASTKGNVILQWYNLGSGLIEAAADRSPEKHGLYTVGTGIPIKSEDEFRKAQPAYALVLPYSFIDEFVEREHEWRSRGGKFLVPLPEFRVV